jgi:CDP-6-deoxy-D-xylo-4-hexulose-3-dehydrase
MNKEKELREEIATRVRQIYSIRKKNEKFIPGISRVTYCGWVFNESEIEALVESSIDFWLTLGPNGRKIEREFADYHL